jgi:8-oxo-dGTP pyrophosphatase MutT (NUDIX family)
VDELERRLREALGGPLPGVEAQLRMAPQPRVGWDPHALPEGLRDGAALVLVYPRDGVLHLPLTVRGASMRTHTGQVSLPGGGVDAGESIETAALRETAEEVGVPPGLVRLLGRLTPLHIPVSRFLLHPVVGVASGRPPFRPAEWEVARILEVPLPSLIGPASVQRRRRVREQDGQPVEIDVPFFDVDGEHVWGATAMVLAEFLAVLERAWPGIGAPPSR